MQMKVVFTIVSLCFLFFPLFVLTGHEGHHLSAPVQEVDTFTPSKEPAEYITRSDQEPLIIKWIGKFHPIFLHFPIALIIMVGMAELLYLWKGSLLCKNAALFMLVAAAIFVIPTVLTGLAFGYNAYYENALTSVFWWHRTFGIITAILAFIAVYLRCRAEETLNTYYLILGLLVVSVSITGYLGGEMTWDFF